MEAGASGHILKDDQSSAQDLANVVLSVAWGGIYFSQKAHEIYSTHLSKESMLLSTRQLEALSLCGAYPNSTTAELAVRMSVSNSTVRNLLSAAYMKLNVNNRAAAISKAQQLGLIAPIPHPSP
jgi:DNA-binding NarL/FixJ family response regulator